MRSHLLELLDGAFEKAFCPKLLVEEYKAVAADLNELGQALKEKGSTITVFYTDIGITVRYGFKDPEKCDFFPSSIASRSDVAAMRTLRNTLYNKLQQLKEVA